MSYMNKETDPQPGDVIALQNSSAYSTLGFGALRTVLRVGGRWVFLWDTEFKEVRKYDHTYFVLIARETREVKVHLPVPSFIAILLTSEGGIPNSLTTDSNMYVAQSYPALKERVEQRIREHPTERWLLLNGGVTASIKPAEVMFRS